MKKKELVSKLLQSGWWLLRQGGSHEIWTNGEQRTSVPRHKEVDEYTGRGILRLVERSGRPKQK